MRRRGGSCLRTVELATVLTLLLSLTPLPRLSPAARAAGSGTPPLPPNATHQSSPLPLPRLPGLALSVAIAPDTLAVGMAATVTVHIVNDGDYPGDDIVVTMAPPAGVTPRPGPGYVSAAAGWRWAVGHLDANGGTSVTGSLLVTAAPPGDALLATATLTARGLPQPVGGEGGAIIDAELAALTNPGLPSPAPGASPSPPAVPSANPAATATRRAATVGALAATPATAATPAAPATPPSPAPSPGPDQGPRTARHVPGQDTTLTSADGKVTVAVPAGATDRAVTLRHAKQPGPGDVGPAGVSLAGRKRGLGAFFLSATDDGGAAVTQFQAPVTIAVRFTPEQLRARHRGRRPGPFLVRRGRPALGAGRDDGRRGRGPGQRAGRPLQPLAARRR